MNQRITRMRRGAGLGREAEETDLANGVSHIILYVRMYDVQSINYAQA